MTMNYVRRGSGRPLLLVHGLGGSSATWSTIIEPLAAVRDVIAVDLPGFGGTPRLVTKTSIASLADAVTALLHGLGLGAIDMVGSSMGARLVLELARRGEAGTVVALDPVGFWSEWERHAYYATVAGSIGLVRMLQPIMPSIAASPTWRSALLAQFSAHPTKIDPQVALAEMRSFGAATAFDELLLSLVYGPAQEGMPRGSARSPIVIGWGRRDLACLPSQARRALTLFPDARLHWFEECGHCPHWDNPAETAQVIIEGTTPLHETAPVPLDMAG